MTKRFFVLFLLFLNTPLKSTNAWKVSSSCEGVEVASKYLPLNPGISKDENRIFEYLEQEIRRLKCSHAGHSIGATFSTLANVACYGGVLYLVAGLVTDSFEDCPLEDYKCSFGSTISGLLASITHSSWNGFWYGKSCGIKEKIKGHIFLRDLLTEAYTFRNINKATGTLLTKVKEVFDPEMDDNSYIELIIFCNKQQFFTPKEFSEKNSSESLLIPGLAGFLNPYQTIASFVEALHKAKALRDQFVKESSAV
jgi:hypothetical protein